MQNHIGLFNLGPGALNTNTLNRINGIHDATRLSIVVLVTYACGVNDIQRYAFDMDGFRHFIAGRAGNRCDNGNIITSQRIK